MRWRSYVIGWGVATLATWQWGTAGFLTTIAAASVVLVATWAAGRLLDHWEEELKR